MPQYDGALAVLDAAIARYPEEDSLKTLRDQIDVESVHAQVEAFKKTALDASGLPRPFTSCGESASAR